MKYIINVEWQLWCTGVKHENLTRLKNELRIAQKSIERTMLGITLSDTKKSTLIQKQTKVSEITEVIKREN